MKKVTSSIIVSLMLLSSASFGASNLKEGVKEVGASIADGMVKEGKKKIAIVEFSDLNDNVNDLGRFLAEKLINELIQNKGDKGYEIVERRQLNKVLKQLKLSSSGLLDPKSMKEVGKILNVDSIVTGSLTDLGNDIDVNARIISVESAKIIAVASTTIPKVGSVATLMGQNSVNISTDTSSNSQSSSSPKKEKSSSNELIIKKIDLEIKLKNIKRKENEISMVAIYTNTSKKPLSFAMFQSDSFLTDGNGEIWKSIENSSISTNPNYYTILLGEKKIISKMKFKAEGDKSGKLFNFSLKYRYKDNDNIKIMLNDVKIP